MENEIDKRIRIAGIAVGCLMVVIGLLM